MDHGIGFIRRPYNSRGISGYLIPYSPSNIFKQWKIYVKFGLHFFLSVILTQNCDRNNGQHIELYNHFTLDVKKWRKEYLDVDSIIISGCRGMCDINTFFDFSKSDSLVIIHPKGSFSHKTRASEKGLLFPVSCKLIKPGGNTWRGKIEVFVLQIL